MQKTRKKFVYIKPKSETSYEFYDKIMLGLQSCEVLEDNKNMYLLKPIRSMQTFWLNKFGDDDWEFEN